MIILPEVAIEKRGTPEPKKGVGDVIRKFLAGVRVAERNLLGPPTVCGDKKCGGCGARQYPLEVLRFHVRRACPELLLIFDDMLHEWRYQAILRVFSGSKPASTFVFMFVFHGRRLICMV